MLSTLLYLSFWPLVILFFIFVQFRLHMLALLSMYCLLVWFLFIPLLAIFFEERKGENHNEHP
ncbi:hypothetical protein EV207_11958 [Scopulibacillus darangshiensis]|uniref:Uncharacterized protein n=1 Tax=Scopulibacillus darangshiensis TaxID=442528 RepID=A0A4R2NX68_9BACL|nr:hypothetical protein EV207_11958 [Scopulibacillus darangshiensis]